MTLKLYRNPDRVGWMGWIETTTTHRALAFVRRDGSVVWDW